MTPTICFSRRSFLVSIREIIKHHQMRTSTKRIVYDGSGLVMCPVDSFRRCSVVPDTRWASCRWDSFLDRWAERRSRCVRDHRWRRVSKDWESMKRDCHHVMNIHETMRIMYLNRRWLFRWDGSIRGLSSNEKEWLNDEDRAFLSRCPLSYRFQQRCVFVFHPCREYVEERSPSSRPDWSSPNRATSCKRISCIRCEASRWDISPRDESDRWLEQSKLRKTLLAATSLFCSVIFIVNCG